MSKTYQRTVLEKLLGKYYKWWYLFRYSFKIGTNYRWSNVSWLINRFLSLIFILLVWFVSAQNGFDLFSFNFIFTYYVIGSLLSFNNTVQFLVAEEIKYGGITTKMIRPSSINLTWYLANFGWSLFPMMVEFMLILSLAVLGVNFLIIPVSFSGFLISLLIFGIGYFCLVQINLIIGYLAFFVVDVWGILDLQISLRWNLSGRAIPLNALAVFAPFLFLPYSFTFHHPMQIYLGKYDTNQIILVFLGGIVWSIVLYFLAKLVFKLGLKQNESVGL